jgi:hypothetical protein
MALHAMNRSEFADSLRLGFDAPDLLKVLAEDTVSPIAIIYDAIDSPYHRAGLLLKRLLNSAGAPPAGDFAYVWAVPAANTALQILGFRLVNNSGAARVFNEKIFRRVDIDAIGADSVDNFQYISKPPVLTMSPCRLEQGTHNADSGATLDQFTLANAGDTGLILFPKPGIVLFGNDPGGIPGWGFRLATVTVGPFTLSVIAREWPLAS